MFIKQCDRRRPADGWSSAAPLPFAERSAIARVAPDKGEARERNKLGFKVGVAEVLGISRPTLGDVIDDRDDIIARTGDMTRLNEKTVSNYVARRAEVKQGAWAGLQDWEE
eukprot:gene2931-15723_t